SLLTHHGWIAGTILAALLVLNLNCPLLPVRSLLVLLIVTVVFWHWWRRILQFGFYTRRFKTLSGTEILLRYAPELKSQMDLKKHIVLWERALAELRKQFGFSLRHRLVVFLFPTVAEMKHLFEVDMGAGAWPHGDAVLVAADYFQTSDFPEECMRHE